jgi:predicted DsbA family dithiol-disulfide isomerase
MDSEKQITIEYFTDVLCVWAYGGQVRVDQLNKDFGDQISVVHRFLPLFAATEERIGKGWRDRGGYAGFNRHVLEIAASMPHVQVHPRLWCQDPPASSTPAHLFLKAMELLQASAGNESASVRDVFERAVWRVRQAFFEDMENVASQAVLEAIAEDLKLPIDAIRRLLDNGHAHAAFHADIEAKERFQVPGSPTLVLQEGRQRLYGNVGYRVIEANVRELLRDPRYGEATWC